jgi:hypothetical protein
MKLRWANYIPHFRPHRCSCHWCDGTMAPLLRDYNLNRYGVAPCFSGLAQRMLRNSAAAMPIRLKSRFVAWGASWGKHHEFRDLELQKSTEGKFGIPKKTSERASAMLRDCFGRKALLLKSLRLLDAAFAMSSFSSQASKNGLAMRSPKSSGKFSGVVTCVMCA